MLYSPEGEDYFCVEPQTSATDNFNLFASGKEEISGLQIVKPLERKKGEFYFQLLDTKGMGNRI